MSEVSSCFLIFCVLVRLSTAAGPGWGALQGFVRMILAAVGSSATG